MYTSAYGLEVAYALFVIWRRQQELTVMKAGSAVSKSINADICSCARIVPCAALIRSSPNCQCSNHTNCMKRDHLVDFKVYLTVQRPKLSGFLNLISVIDCTHIEIWAPQQDGQLCLVTEFW